MAHRARRCEAASSRLSAVSSASANTASVLSTNPEEGSNATPSGISRRILRGAPQFDPASMLSQARHAIDARLRPHLAIRGHRTRGLQGEATWEDCQATQPNALGFGEQLVAPVHSRPQGLMARRCGPAALREEPETVVEPGRKALYPKVRGACRRYLHCQRDAGQATPNSGDPDHT